MWDGRGDAHRVNRSPKTNQLSVSASSLDIIWRQAGPLFADATSITIEIIRKFVDQTSFAVHPRRWVVERTFAWIKRNRRLASDFEHSRRSATAFLYAATALVLVRRLARFA